MHRILIVEDEPTIRKGLKVWFEKSQFEVVEAEDGKVAIDLLQKDKFDIVILDVMMPYFNGYEVLQFIHESVNEYLPVIMLTAKADEEDKILGLNLGADDYMTKPFSNRELEARIRAHLRRKETFLESDHSKNLKSSMFEIDFQKYLIINGDKTSEITRKELELLDILIQHKENFVTKEFLLDKVWGYLDTKKTRTLDIHVSKIRRKLEDVGVKDVIDTKRGVGYKYTEKSE
ncbi:MAG: response regulator transcription factor [Mycoplasmatales bacterium]